MSMPHPVTRYRPTKVSDGHGGFAESRGTGVTVYCIIRINENEITAILDKDEDVDIGDILVSQES